MFSASFVTLLISGLTSVLCLVNEKVTVQPFTITENATVTSYSDFTQASASSIACGNTTSKCLDTCKACYDISNGTTMNCLSSFVGLCVYNFEKAMYSLNNTDWCVWHNVGSLYSNMSQCTEHHSECLGIPWPNSLVEETFVRIHYEYFHDCPTEELSDPPPAIIFALVITPICLIPVMVSLVVFKTKNGDGSA